MHTITTIAASKSFTADRLWLNGKEIEINGRGQTCLREIRRLARSRVDPTTGEVIVAAEDWPQYHVHISSVNTFPTGAGLASSAAGLACFVATLAKLYNAQETYPGEFTAIARQGSGSASRSLFGGFVKWIKGDKPDGTDSIAVQIADENVSSCLQCFVWSPQYRHFTIMIDCSTGLKCGRSFLWSVTRRRTHRLPLGWKPAV